ncbi:hypothetical protein DV735_g1683, partial [Chaetothyriales sp. CBS 134920]
MSANRKGHTAIIGRVMPLQPRRGRSNRRANIWTARIIPILLLGIVAYCSWVLTDLVCVRYLLQSGRYGPAIATLTTFYLVLLIVLATYARLITTVITNPGVVPRGPQYYVEKEARSLSEKEAASDAGSSEGFGKLPRSRHDDKALIGEDFWHKDVFVCQYDGRPPFCSQCYNYKPTRSHHCSELGRCVLKMDHFCPWIGGIVSETSFKFFILFTFWAALFTLHVLVVMAYFLADRRQRETGFVINVHWVVVLALAALFLLFSAGMCISSLQFAFLNTTTIENLSRRSHVWYLAVYVPEPVVQHYHASGRSDVRLIVYPRPPAEQQLILQQSNNSKSMSGSSSSPEQKHESLDASQRPTTAPQQRPPLTRTFAILETKPGANPFDIGCWNNFKDVMGHTVLDWSSPPPLPGSRHYYSPRSSATMAFASSFDHANYSRGSLELQGPSRRSSIYEAQPTKRYSYQDGPRGPVSAIHYSMRPRTNSAVQPDSRPQLNMLAQNGPPARNHSVMSNPVRSDHRGSLVVPSTPRYLLPAVSHGREHQRHYSATRAEIDRTASLTRSAAGGVRPRSEYHHAGGYNSSGYTSSSRVKDDDFSYTGPREQFARDYPSRPPDRRDSLARRERPVSVYEIAGYKDATSVGRRDTAPPSPASRQVDRLDRNNAGRSNGRPVYESEPDRPSGLTHHRHSMRAPVVHQIREDEQRDYPRHDSYESRSRVRRDTIEEDLPTRPRVERAPVEDLQPRSRKERYEDLPVRYKKDRFEDDAPRKERYVNDESSPRPRREHVIEADLSPRLRPERGTDRDQLRERDYDKDRDRTRDHERSRDSDRLRPAERKRSDDQRGSRSRDNSPAPGHAKALAAGLGGLAAAGLAGPALKSSPKAEENSDGDSRKERKGKKHRHHHHHHDDDEDHTWRDQRSAPDRKAPVNADERPEERKRGSRREDSASESPDDGRDHQRHHKHRDREPADAETASQPRGGQVSGEPDATPLEEGDHSRRRRRASRANEEAPTDLERRTLSPENDEGDRPRRVQLVEPLKEKEEFKPKGILKAPRTVPFPEDPNPTREGVAPLKDAGKEGVPPNARWTKISRVLVNPEALEKAQERFEEREDYVIVLRVLRKDEIQKLAEKTQEIRANREKEWQEELERQRAKKSIEDKEVDEKAIPLLDQVPANQSLDGRVLTNADDKIATPGAPGVPSVAPILDINVATANHSSNV